MIYIFDGTLEGLLTAIFESYQRKDAPVKLVSENFYQPDAFDESYTIISDEAKAGRVWMGLGKKLDGEWMLRFYKSYLSEQPAIFQRLFDFARYIFNPKGAEADYGNSDVLEISQMAQKVHREKHRMEAFVRFQQTGDGMFYAGVEPDFNVLPLILEHFRKRYADQQWIIYDLKRKYGLFYDLEKVATIELDFKSEFGSSQAIGSELLDPKEELYSLLWKDYFKSTNIPARKNQALLEIPHGKKRILNTQLCNLLRYPICNRLGFWFILWFRLTFLTPFTASTLFDTDEILWTRLREGDEAAFSALFERYFGALVNYGKSLGPTNEQVRDCVQDVFADLWLYKKNLNESVVVKAYLLSSVRKRIARVHERDRILGRTAPLEEALFLMDFTVQDQLIADEEMKAKVYHLNDLVNALPSRQKEVIYLRYHEGINLPEIADMMNINYQSVVNLLYKAIQQLRGSWVGELPSLLFIIATILK
jgi:probable DNA metabolism protein